MPKRISRAILWAVVAFAGMVGIDAASDSVVERQEQELVQQLDQGLKPAEAVTRQHEIWRYISRFGVFFIVPVVLAAAVLGFRSGRPTPTPTAAR